MGPCLQKPIMKVPLFTQRTFLFYHTEDIYFHTEYHGISRRFLNRDYNFDYFSVTISEKRKSVTIRDSPCEKKKNLRVKKENP